MKQEQERQSIKDIALSNEIIRGVVGSTVYGTAVKDQDDRDEMGIFVEPPFYVCGLDSVDHYSWRSKSEGVRSGSGDTDLIIFSLRKFCKLAASGNPSILVFLWLPLYLQKEPFLAERLLSIRGAFVSQEAGKTFLGYLHSQKQCLTGQRKKNVVRQDLVDLYGFDTKYAMHALRLAYQGIEYIKEGKITIPIPGASLQTLRAVRKGLITFSDTFSLINDAEQGLIKAAETCPKKINRVLINDTMISIHQEHWVKNNHA